jgi:hypothetical protein
MAGLDGCWLRGTVATTVFVAGSIRDTELSSRFETQTAVLETAGESGLWWPTSIVVTAFRSG